MHDKILIFVLAIIFPFFAHAQFHTITKEREIDYSQKKNNGYNPEIQDFTMSCLGLPIGSEPKEEVVATNIPDSVNARKCNDYTLPESRYDYAKARGRKPRSKEKDRAISVTERISTAGLPELTIPNLYAEIKKNNIKYPKIVLAQAILETGWFKSSVCRNKNNLFGLTNPHTKTYYEFDHWTESVAAYYSKVQYRYKGGNYLLWLRDIGYAEDKGYIQAVIRVLKQL